MSSNGLPRRVLYGELLHGARSQGRQKKHFSDHIKAILKKCNIPTDQLLTLAADRSTWWPGHVLIGVQPGCREPLYPPARHYHLNTKQPVLSYLQPSVCFRLQTTKSSTHRVTSDYQQSWVLVVLTTTSRQGKYSNSSTLI